MLKANGPQVIQMKSAAASNTTLLKFFDLYSPDLAFCTSYIVSDNGSLLFINNSASGMELNTHLLHLTVQAQMVRQKILYKLLKYVWIQGTSCVISVKEYLMILLQEKHQQS